MSMWQARYLWRRRFRRFVLAPNIKRVYGAAPEGSGRAALVERFHDLRQRPIPPTFVIEGPRGMGKSHLVTRLRKTFREDQAWVFAEDIDARIDMTRGAPEPEPVLDLIRGQLRSNSSVWRPLPTPRFQLMRGHLHRHRRRTGELGPSADTVAAEVEWMLGTGARLAASAFTGTPPIVTPSIKAGPVRWMWLARTKLRIGAAAKWTRSQLSNLPDINLAGERDTLVGQRLERLLATAMAADLAHATRREKLRIGQIIIFIDAYHRVEAESTNPTWLAEFADDLRAEGAHVMLVLSCRFQRVWSNRLDLDESSQDYAHFIASDDVEVHHLRPLGWQERTYLLARYGVPAELSTRLAATSRGHPLALRLLGMRFGTSTAITDRDRSDAVLLSRLPKGNRIDEEWVADFCAIISPSIFDGLDHDVAWHARAASTLRAFDRALLASVMQDGFRGDALSTLVETPLVERLTPSVLLTGQKVYRVRRFVGDFCSHDQTAPETERRWHERAAEFFSDAAATARDAEQGFAVQVEQLFHRLALTGTEAEQELASVFSDELAAGRYDRCELLLRCANDSRSSDVDWSARVAAMAGRMYLAGDLYELAEERLRESEELLVDSDDAILAVTVAQSLARCLRLRGKLEDASDALARVMRLAPDNPVARFQAVWNESLLAATEGELSRASSLAADAEEMLEDLLQEPNMPHNLALADRLGIAPLPRKRIHLLRHRADLARRAGRYVDAITLIGLAERGYQAQPEASAFRHLRALESHVLRAEGYVREAIARAEALRLEIASSSSADRRTGLAALRCLAQARMASDDPESARPLLDALVSAGPEVYPAGHILGCWGLGELARVQGDYVQAEICYKQALTDNGTSRRIFERVYVQLGRAEVARMTNRAAGAIDRVDRLLRLELCREHPVLEFWAHLIAARCQVTSAGSGMISDMRFEQAELADKRIRRRAGATSVESLILGAARQCAGGELDPPAPVMLLP